MTLDTILTQLVTAQLVRRAGEEETTYLFKHTLTQETAYESLLHAQLREIHRSVAHAYEAEFGDQCRDQYAGILARHYAESGDDAKTVEYATHAGHLAARQYANAEAIAFYSLALNAARRIDATAAQFVDLYTQRGRVFEVTGQFQKAAQNYRELEALALARNDRPMQLAALVALATIYSTATDMADSAQARQLSNVALVLAHEIGDRKTPARVLWNLMLLSTFLGEMPQAIEYGEQSLAISRELGMREQTALTLNDLSRPYVSLGQFARARAAIQQALVVFRETDNQPMLADGLGRFAAVNLAVGQIDEMVAAAQAAQTVSEATGNLWGQSFSRLFVGPVYFERGDLSLAYRCMQDCIRLAEQAGFMIPQVKVRAELAQFYGALGKVREGIELAEQAQAVALKRLPYFECKACATLARLYAWKGDLVQAEVALKRSYATLNEDFAQQVVDQLAIADIEIALARKDYAHAIAVADESFERFRKLGFHTFRGQVLYLQAHALRALGNEDAARQVLVQAKEEAEQVGSRWTLWQIHAALGERALAREIVEYLSAHCPAELRESFLNVPSVRAVMEAQ